MAKSKQKARYKFIPESAGGEDEDLTNFLLTLEDLQMLYRALKQYQPTEKEEPYYDILLESFEEEIFTEIHLDEI